MMGEYIRGPRMGAYEGNNANTGQSIAAFADTAASFIPGGAEAEAAWGIFQTIVGWFGSGPSRWDTAGAGVHDWFHYHAEQAFQDWLDVKNPGAYASLEACKAARYYWTYTGAPGNQPPIPAGFLRQIYDPLYRLATDADMNNMAAGMGIDLPASLLLHTQNGYPNTHEALNTLNPNFIVPIPGYGQQVNGIVEQVIEDIDAGKPLTDGQADVAGGLLNDSDAEAQRETNTTLLITAGAAAAGLFLR